MTRNRKTHKDHEAEITWEIADLLGRKPTTWEIK